MSFVARVETLAAYNTISARTVRTTSFPLVVLYSLRRRVPAY